MTPAQRRQCRDILRARADQIATSGAEVGWLLAAARVWAGDLANRDAMWNTCAMVVRAERLADLRIRVDVVTEIEALLDEIRIAVGGRDDDGDFKRPWVAGVR